MKTTFNFLNFFIVCLLLVSCSSDDISKSFDYGKVENDIYSNSFFNFSLNIPPNWVVQNKEQIEQLTNMGKKLLAGDDKNLKTIIEASEINSANLLAVFKHEVGSPVDYNPNLMIVVENLKNTPGIKTGSDYLYQAHKLLKQAQMQYDYIDDEFKNINIGGKEFYMMKAGISNFGVNVKQIYYSIVQNGFSLNMIISYGNEEQKNELDKAIKSVSFK